MDQSGQAAQGIPEVQQAAPPAGEAAAGGAAAPAMPAVAATPVPVPPPPPPMKGNGPGRLIETILVVLMFVAAAGFVGLFIWQNTEWEKANTDLENRKEEAREIARAEQEELDSVYYKKRAADAYDTFTAPDNYGQVSFRYLKTWSVYVANDANKGGNFEAYLNPGKVEAVGVATINALRVMIWDQPWDTVIKKYDNLVTTGKLDMLKIQVGGGDANRYDGEFSKDIKGTMVLIKIRDKTVELRTDSVEFRPEFEVMLDTITYKE